MLAEFHNIRHSFTVHCTNTLGTHSKVNNVSNNTHTNTKRIVLARHQSEEAITDHFTKQFCIVHCKVTFSYFHRQDRFLFRTLYGELYPRGRMAVRVVPTPGRFACLARVSGEIALAPFWRYRDGQDNSPIRWSYLYPGIKESYLFSGNCHHRP